MVPEQERLILRVVLEPFFTSTTESFAFGGEVTATWPGC